ncbi:unnamed protein product, partial [Mesorhabditis belari]|uniref:Secreted protein n=1 Tax=Mesorhabditis belari TaxID=2138241 RepID=A0AAF3EX58_9BILA
MFYIVQILVMRLATQCATGMRTYGRWFNPEIRAAVRHKNLREGAHGSAIPNVKKSSMQFPKEITNGQQHPKHKAFRYKHQIHSNPRKQIPPSQHSPTCPPPN